MHSLPLSQHFKSPASLQPLSPVFRHLSHFISLFEIIIFWDIWKFTNLLTSHNPPVLISIVRKVNILKSVILLEMLYTTFKLWFILLLLFEQNICHFYRICLSSSSVSSVSSNTHYHSYYMEKSPTLPHPHIQTSYMKNYLQLFETKVTNLGWVPSLNLKNRAPCPHPIVTTHHSLSLPISIGICSDFRKPAIVKAIPQNGNPSHPALLFCSMFMESVINQDTLQHFSSLSLPLMTPGDLLCRFSP